MIRRVRRAIGRLRRAGRRTNVALLVVLVGAAVTGGLAFAAGTPVPARLATLLHGVFGLAVVVLVPWKSVIVRRALVLRAASLALVVLIVICIASGLVEVFLGYGVFWRLSPMQIHVGSAALAVPLLAWHVLRHRRQRLRRVDFSRRTLLRTGVLAAGVAATYGALEGIGRLAESASARRIATGSHSVSADAVPATMWLFDKVPVVGTDHRVNVAGTAFTVSDLASRGRTITARLDCTSGWYADAEWTAVKVADLLPPEQLATASSIEVVSVTGYRRRFPAEDAGALWLATAYQGEPLRPAYGAPVRLVAPHRR
ncbi:MAG TPA: molybdopterin-dependent oxidoreductase, partial [Propionibacteriaceae bacterium]|nr:molybdopterin-dependent oxidoreductase [Propionibacteriaceae bacterium]